MSLSQDEVLKVASLSRLELKASELESLTSELQQIVGYVDQLSEVDTTDIEPMVHAIELSNVFAEDKIAPSLSREDALSNAPNHNDEAFLVPPVLGD